MASPYIMHGIACMGLCTQGGLCSLLGTSFLGVRRLNSRLLIGKSID